VNIADQNSGAATPLVDFDQLQSACDGDSALMRELVDLYFQQAGEIMTGLEKAIAAGSVPDVNHLAHKLAGSSLACGVSAMVPSLRQLEMGAKAGHLDGANDLFAQSAANLEVVRAHLRDYLSQLPPP
jgi:HPt (histidine-containing phosphotransfer) domain-containing protein